MATSFRRDDYIYELSKIGSRAGASPAPEKLLPQVTEAGGVEEHAERKAGYFTEAETSSVIPHSPGCIGTPETGERQPAEGDLGAKALTEAIDRSERFDGAGFFTNRLDRLVDMTGTAFELLQALNAGGEAALDLAISRFPPGLRQRAPSRSKPELLAVQMTAKPATTEERKICSSHASLLIVAQANGITVDRFRDWARNIPLADAELQAKRIRDALGAVAREDRDAPHPAAAPTYNLEVTVVIDGKRKDAARLAIQDHEIEDVHALVARARGSHDLIELREAFAQVRSGTRSDP